LSRSDPLDHWNDPKTVRRFAERAADHRLVELLARWPTPASVRVLDLGCAGGRNAELLAVEGFDFHAIDAAKAMVRTTCVRVAAVLGEEEARRRVVQGRMDDLAAWGEESVDLVVALGVYHQAQSEDEWYAALAETERVLVQGGLCLVSNFSPGTGTLAAPLPPVEGTRFLYEGMHEDRLCLRDAAGLDADLADLGLVPETPTRVVERVVEDRRRVTVNALYVKLPHDR